MLGFAPVNHAGPDANIDSHPLVMGDAEKAAIDGWMDQGGGVFATGDHDYLGATMCQRIARVGAMRKWTNADGVPPISDISKRMSVSETLWSARRHELLTGSLTSPLTHV